MAVRNKRKCRNCPEETVPMASSMKPQAESAPLVFQLSSESEGPRLWSRVLMGVLPIVGMIEDYSRINMPGAPREMLKALVTRLQGVTARIENPSPNQPVITPSAGRTDRLDQAMPEARGDGDAPSRPSGEEDDEPDSNEDS